MGMKRDKEEGEVRVGCRSRSWDREASLGIGKALTRDGRLVVDLKEEVIGDGETVLVGKVSTRKMSEYRGGDMIVMERMYWVGGGFGVHGGDDLMTVDVW